MVTRRALSFAALAPLLAACSVSGMDVAEPLSAANAAADRLIARLPLEAHRLRFGATTFADANDITQVVPLGRMISEQIANRFVSAHGVNLVEIRMSTALIMDSAAKGELLLTRAARDHARIAGVDYFLLGTVSRVGTRSYVSARLVRVEDGTVVAADSFVTSV